jgi:hypothetical protein
MIMGPVMAALQTFANGINALVIQATPGYENVSIKTLMMLWYSRPRLAWLIVGMVAFQADEAMYLSCAATTLTAEIILQLLSAYTMGSAANYARAQKFYTNANGNLAAPRGSDAMLMYGGALTWLIVVAFSLTAVGKSVWDVNFQIGQIGRVIGVDSWASGRLSRTLETELESARSAWRTAEEKARRSTGQEQTTWMTLAVHFQDQARTLGDLISSLESLLFVVNGPESAYKAAVRKLGTGFNTPPSKTDPNAAEVDRLAQLIRSCAEGQTRDVITPTLQRLKDQQERLLLILTPTDQTRSGKTAVRIRWKKLQSYCEALGKNWNSRQALLSSHEWQQETRRKLRGVIRNTILGMAACWIAQWLFWIGFVRLYTPDA